MSILSASIEGFAGGRRTDDQLLNSELLHGVLCNGFVGLRVSLVLSYPFLVEIQVIPSSFPSSLNIFHSLDIP
jgi:hypothetical protein